MEICPKYGRLSNCDVNDKVGELRCCFHSRSSYSIGNLLGKPLKTDSATASLVRPSVARISVEVDISKELPHCVWIHLGQLTFHQPITYEDLPEYCPSCKCFGHKNCKTKSKSSKWVKPEVKDTFGTGNTSLAVAPKPAVTLTNQERIESVLQPNQAASIDEEEEITII
ncbi:unnamed protein product [Cuscuta campestris]|uniref:DUF4283 domain-containing protein n=1 Tax=Cuscuta campestris TaxID=132261 RepID=A0A484L3I5_9ASTE|nr:unnamed protein product [Cuscuta campestris]